MADVLATLRRLNDWDPHIAHLEVRKLQAALLQHGCAADLPSVESARGWLLVDGLEIMA